MESLFEFSPIVVAVVPVALGLVQLIKTAGLPTRLAPIASLLVGIGLITLLPDLSWQATLAQGLIVGLAASGLWSGSKTTAGR